MRKILSLLLLSLFILPLGADVFSHPFEGDLKELEELSPDFSSSAVVSDYKQTKLVKKLNRELVSEGTFLLKPGSGMVWQASKPYASVMLVGRDSVRQRTGTGKVSVLDVSSNQVYLSIAGAIESIVLGDYAHAAEVFWLYLERDGDSWTLGFKPKDEALGSYMASVIVMGQGQRMESVLMEERAGNTILYEFEGLVPTELTDEEEALFSL